MQKSHKAFKLPIKRIQVPELWKSETLEKVCQKALQPDRGINIIQDETSEQPDRLRTVEYFGPNLGHIFLVVIDTFKNGWRYVIPQSARQQLKLQLKHYE